MTNTRNTAKVRQEIATKFNRRISELKESNRELEAKNKELEEYNKNLITQVKECQEKLEWFKNHANITDDQLELMIKTAETASKIKSILEIGNKFTF